MDFQGLRGWSFRLLQQLLNHLFLRLVATFSEVGETHLPFGVDQVVRGPVLVIEVSPDRVVVIDGYRVSDSELFT